jgi:uncharacterized protein
MSLLRVASGESPAMFRPGETARVTRNALLATFLVLIALPAQPANRLAKATSRYLLQHATNPVDWYPWGPEAFAEAKKQNKPIFLSVGYSTCYWCHVMNEESFADPEIGKLMNDALNEESFADTGIGQLMYDAFVSIKVDREERPDIDSVYLSVTRTLTGDAGWPNNVILTPDGKPFYAASYVPKERFRALIPRIATMWSDQRERVVSSADMVLRALDPQPVAAETLTVEVLTKGFRQLESRFDPEHGGFLPAPKFPSAHHMMFLLRYWKRTGDAKALEMVEKTLREMRSSALWDGQGFGFHRYASDAAWSEPHYEKMLYDQAMLALVYTETYQATRKAEYAQTAREIFTYVLRDLRAPDGSFYAAQDADETYYTSASRAKLATPGIDKKILADWNGLMIAALSFGAVVLDQSSYARAAAKAADVVVARRRPFLDDYAFLVWGLLNLYEATFDIRHLQSAIELHGETVKLFRDGSGRFYITASNAEKLLVRPRETGDGAIPSGNSVELMNLVRLARITADSMHEKQAQDLLRTVADEVSLAPSASPHLLSGLDFILGPSLEIVLAGDDVSAMHREVFSRFVPNKVVLHRPAAASPLITKIAPFTKEQRPIGRKTTAYVCTNHLCRLPTTDPKKIWR